MPTDFSAVYRMFANIEQGARQAEEAIRGAAKRRADAVRASAAARLPGKGDTEYATGTTREHLHVVEDLAHKQYRVEVADIPGRDPMVPVYHEFGTVGQAARPFLRPAVDENRSGYLRDAEAAVKNVERAL